MTPQQLVEILKRHDSFIRGRKGGTRADLKQVWKI